MIARTPLVVRDETNRLALASTPTISSRLGHGTVSFRVSRRKSITPGGRATESSAPRAKTTATFTSHCCQAAMGSSNWGSSIALVDGAALASAPARSASNARTCM